MKGRILLVFAFFIFACGGAKQPPPQPTETAGIQAAKATALNNPNCVAINPFYWEIGDRASSLVSGTTGDNSIEANTNLAIASATKWLFGAYVIEREGGNLDATTIKHLTMSSGYTSFGIFICASAFITTVQDCYDAGTNSLYTAAHDGFFFYNGGHFQNLGVVELGMGPLSESTLASEFQTQLGADIELAFGSPQLAGGIKTTGLDYAKFLRKILAGELLMKQFLGSSAVCTLPSTCATAVSSPLSEDFHYSLGHWVEDDPATGDGSFSSPGLYGFYPWIDSSMTYYGLISRYELPSGSNEIGSGYESLLCGRLIRRAFLTGESQ